MGLWLEALGGGWLPASSSFWWLQVFRGCGSITPSSLHSSSLPCLCLFSYKDPEILEFTRLCCDLTLTISAKTLFPNEVTFPGGKKGMDLGVGHASTAPFLGQFPSCWLLCPEQLKWCRQVASSHKLFFCLASCGMRMRLGELGPHAETCTWGRLRHPGPQEAGSRFSD